MIRPSFVRKLITQAASIRGLPSNSIVKNGTNKIFIRSSHLTYPNQEGDKVPKVIKQDPVRQVQLKPIRVEYHGVECSKFNDESIWVPLYRFPYIRTIRSFIRFKVYLTGASIAACTYQASQILVMSSDGAHLLGTSLLSSLSLVGILSVGHLCRKLIVQVYTSEDQQHVRLCRFTFFGKRMDMVFPKEQIISLSETNITQRIPFLALKIRQPENIDLSYDTYEFYDEVFRITLRFGGVLDMERFEQVLGRVLSRKA